ncbi:valine--tRNA ligase [Malacoplasma penetrans]|uniref:Valine--tRNA ligase n=1 Tax=Malacoplasma penetrans (strain HF-2) TaxID=272633 RepID=SYV_MALP2|nr:valine--tRNA ligase [Malacoplasma penetrans]Q8EX08.2 RecName: Full=Valine--tRNA ligase; AltName: Full=Valyl-tRNA synthetase; Short=ValRS [Malacoplasma penetrans HF-2]
MSNIKNNNDLSKKYDHKICEQQFSLWTTQKELNKKNLKANKNSYSILLPPPNVTGNLHLGHALNGTIQDCLIRFNNLKGLSAYWICGMDHAGIATQTKYEKYLRENKISNKDKSRDEKVADLFEWSQNVGNNIRNQWKNMGFFLDYENEHFTLEKKSNEMVNQVFVKMYNDGLIYRSKTLVNWDIKLQSAISNIEVIKKEVETNLYYIRYYLSNSKDYLLVATTRPETIFVDECLVVNPKDKRYKNYINKFAINPLTNKEIKIIADEYVDIQFGTGVMKCTPAHDFNDYELGKKYKLNIISCFNEDGTTNNYAVGFENLKIADARVKCVEYLEKNNLLEKVEKTISNVGFSERTNAVVEPMMSEQWFVKVSEYSKKVIELQKSSKKIQFFPIKFEKNLINWMTNLNDWCISRQLWWGHQIPVWYKKDSKEIYVGTKPPKNEELYVRDNDVLDTWFSSGLWPITTTDALKSKDALFPTNVLVTGFDIIFFWVFRMMFFSLYLKKEVPFKHCYITGLIRDEHNNKMSKSLGNGVDPNDVIEKYGADALRLFLLSSSSPGEDLCYVEEKVKSCWGFINKLWNSFRYVEMNSSDFNFDEDKTPKNLEDFDKWILNKFNKAYSEFLQQFNKYNFLVSIKKILDFTWDDFCNTYIELSKNRTSNQESKLWVLNYLIKKILILFHPMCPFVTSNLYDNFKFKTKDSILLERLDFKKISNLKESSIEDVLQIINKIRIFNFENKIPNNKVIDIHLEVLNPKLFKISDEVINILNTAKINIVKQDIKSLKPDYVENNYLIFILNKEDLLGSNNEANNIEKIKKEIEFVKSEISRCNGMLSNKSFIEKAPKEKIELEKSKKEKHEMKLKELEKLLSSHK